MLERNQIYKCTECGSIIEILHGGAGDLKCCGKPMISIKENTVDASVEKHVPVIEKIAGGFKVTVGSVIHPMVDNHYIEWIELLANGRSYKKFFKPGDEPIATFLVEASEVTAREYCNLHGLWTAKV
jgi:superoxide reductase